MVGGLTIVVANVIWVAMALHFAKGASLRAVPDARTLWSRTTARSATTRSH